MLSPPAEISDGGGEGGGEGSEAVLWCCHQYSRQRSSACEKHAEQCALVIDTTNRALLNVHTVDYECTLVYNGGVH